MKTTLSKVASALSFAHLTKLGKSKAEDDEDKKERDHEDGDAKKSKADDKKEDEYADVEDDDAEASGDSPDSDDGDEDDDKKAKKAKSEDDSDKDEEMRGNSNAAAARRREQARCAAIFASPMAARNPVLAANLAFKTRMTRKEAIAVLEGTPAPSSMNVDRAKKNPNVGSGSSPVVTSQQAISGSWDVAFKKARGGR